MEVHENRRCRLYEIEQFICEIENKQNNTVRCYPLPRVFHMCPGRPVVEVTALVEINSETGEMSIPELYFTSQILPQGKVWKDCAAASGNEKNG
ncbi:hypothetical protein K439DRAFT_1333434 [Ramaria rubella]|nr:hypothetical protein K439DRAFT_1333434 [Ramaria rubella]